MGIAGKIPAIVGRRYPGMYAYGQATLATGANNLICSVAYSGPTAITLSQLGTYIAGAYGAGGIVKVGVYTADRDPFANPTTVVWTLVTDPAANTASSTTTGDKAITLTASVVIPANTWFALGGVEQVSASGTRYVSNTASTAAMTPFGAASGSNPYANSANGLSFFVGGVNGNLPATINGMTSFTGYDSGIDYLRSA